MLNGGSMVWGFCVYFVYMIPLETDVLRKHRFQKPSSEKEIQFYFKILTCDPLDLHKFIVLNLKEECPAQK